MYYIKNVLSRYSGNKELVDFVLLYGLSHISVR